MRCSVANSQTFDFDALDRFGLFPMTLRACAAMRISRRKVNLFAQAVPAFIQDGQGISHAEPPA
jgi:hypothetical protein